jgi:hypothetical protein
MAKSNSSDVVSEEAQALKDWEDMKGDLKAIRLFLKIDEKPPTTPPPDDKAKPPVAPPPTIKAPSGVRSVLQRMGILESNPPA